MLDMIIRMLDAMPETASYEYDEEDKTLDITGEDFAGFDEDWSELDNENFDEKKWDEFIKFLKDNCKAMIDDYYAHYVFDDFYVTIGYASYDI
jgi:hypothetical protein